MTNHTCPNCGYVSAVTTTAHNRTMQPHEGTAGQLLVAIAVISGLAFAVYHWLLAV